MKKCEYFFELISTELDGELGETEREELFEHLEACEKCRSLRAMMADMSDETAKLGAEPPDGFTKNVMRRIKSSEKPRILQIFALRPFTLIAAAAVLAIVIFSSGGLEGLLDRVAFTGGTESAADTGVKQNGEDRAEPETPATDTDESGTNVTGEAYTSGDSGGNGEDSADGTVISEPTSSNMPSINADDLPKDDETVTTSVIPEDPFDTEFSARIGVFGVQARPKALAEYTEDEKSTADTLYFIIPAEKAASLYNALEAEGCKVVSEEGNKDSETGLIIVTINGQN